MTLLDGPDARLAQWLALCGLAAPDSAYALVGAAIEDWQRSPALQQMLQAPPEDFLNWWYAQDYQPWQLTTATGSTDWAWLVLARAGAAVSDSRFGGL